MTLHFRADRVSGALTLIALPPLILLGLWQLERAEHKRALLELHRERSAGEAIDLADVDRSLPDEALRGLRVRLDAVFDPSRQWFIDNRTRSGSVGYEVVTPARVGAMGEAGAVWTLVNRGWVAGDPARRALPEVPIPPAQRISVSGAIYIPHGRALQLAADPLAEDWPRVLQNVDVERMAAALDAADVFPYEVRMEPDQPGALLADWQPVAVAPQKHVGYAFQWFGLACVLAGLFVARSVRRGGQNDRA